MEAKHESTKKKRIEEKKMYTQCCVYRGKNELIQHFDFHCTIGQTVIYFFFVYAMMVTTATSVPLDSDRIRMSE